MKIRVLKPEEHYINHEPYYQPIGEEIRFFDAAYKQQLPVLL
jgi:nitric oxide reductase NorQ protein